MSTPAVAFVELWQLEHLDVTPAEPRLEKVAADEQDVPDFPAPTKIPRVIFSCSTSDDLL